MHNFAGWKLEIYTKAEGRSTINQLDGQWMWWWRVEVRPRQVLCSGQWQLWCLKHLDITNMWRKHRRAHSLVNWHASSLPRSADTVTFCDHSKVCLCYLFRRLLASHSPGLLCFWLALGFGVVWSSLGHRFRQPCLLKVVLLIFFPLIIKKPLFGLQRNVVVFFYCLCFVANKDWTAVHLRLPSRC